MVSRLVGTQPRCRGVSVAPQDWEHAEINEIKIKTQLKKKIINPRRISWDGAAGPGHLPAALDSVPAAQTGAKLVTPARPLDPCPGPARFLPVPVRTRPVFDAVRLSGAEPPPGIYLVSLKSSLRRPRAAARYLAVPRAPGRSVPLPLPQSTFLEPGRWS